MLDMNAVEFDLTLFDGDGGAAGAAAAEAPGAAPEGNVSAQTPGKPGKAPRHPLAHMQYGKQPDGADAGSEAAAQGTEKPAQGAGELGAQGDKDAKRAEFERLIKGDYAGEFAERTQRIIDERFKGAKALEERVGALEPVMEMLASRYGVKPDDPEALVKALREDNGFYEQEALRRGLTVEQLKVVKQLEAENAELRSAQQKQRQQQEASRTMGEWMRQSDELKQMYTGFDLRNEINDPRTGREFLRLLQSHVPVRTAYEVIHRDEIMSGAMRYTAQQVRQKTMEDIRTRGMRPEENGAGGQGPAHVKTDVRSLTKADRAEIARRVARGERITF